MIYFKLIVLVSVLKAAKTDGVKRIAEIEGDVNIALMINYCRNASEVVPYRIQTLTSSAVWTTNRVNYLESLSPLKLGLSVYETCSESDYYKTVFDLYQQEEEYLLGVISDKNLNEKILKFCDVLDIPVKVTKSYYNYLIKASVQFLSAVGWTENVTILCPDENLLKEFYRYSKREFICIKDCLVYGSSCPVLLNTTAPFVFFGHKHHVDEFVKKQNFFENFDDINAVFVPLDGSVPKDLPDKSYVIIPPHSPPSTIYRKPETILPTPLLFEVATPILTYAKTIQSFITGNCNETLYKVNCLRSKFNKKYYSVLMTPNDVTEILKIEPMKENIVYNVFRVENDSSNATEVMKRNDLLQPFTKFFKYSLFDDKLTPTEQNFEISSNNTPQEYAQKCVSYFSDRKYRYILSNESEDILNFRSESWVFAFLSLSFLGVLFCISILIFLLISIFRRDILEGNPMLTIALLLAVMLLFCAVLPFSLEYNKYNKQHLCFARSLAVTLGYAVVLSLLLSRCILLATASKEIGFMSHIAGPVQAFLCLFIFGVQAALSLNIVGKCLDIFRGYAFVYLMSYNTMLLLLLLCLCPLIYKCQRNYREGKYFTISIVLTTCVWSIWLPCYAFLDEDWKEPILCFGLVSTASIFLGSIFIPRTYLITIAAARDKITSTLPSLTTATSAMDIYRANTQPIYDCVNVAAINAVTVARAGVTATAPSMHTLQQPDLYSCPALPDDEDFDFRCDTPPGSEKVTRF